MRAMAIQAYPDLMDPWELTVVPVRGLPCGDGLILHGGENHRRLAEALGFRWSNAGYVFDPGESNLDFSRLVTRAGAAVSALLPMAAFAFVDPEALAWDASAAGGDMQSCAARRHRFEIRSALAQAPPAPPSAVLRSGEGAASAPAELLAIVGRVLDADAGVRHDEIALPCCVRAEFGIHAYALSTADGIRLGVFARGSRVPEPPGLSLRAVPDADGPARYAIEGRGAADVLYDAPLTTHLLGTALSRMSAELYAATVGMTASYACQYGALHDRAFPGWATCDDEASRERETGPTSHHR